MSNKHLAIVSSSHRYHPHGKTIYTVQVFRTKKAWQDASLEDIEGALQFFKDAKAMLERHEEEMKKYHAAKTQNQ